MLHVFIPEQDPQAVDDSVDLQPSLQASHAWLSESGCVKLGLLGRLRFYADEHKEDFQGCTVKPEDVRSCPTIKDFEKATVCQLYRFSSLDEYNRPNFTHQNQITCCRSDTSIIIELQGMNLLRGAMWVLCSEPE